MKRQQLENQLMLNLTKASGLSTSLKSQQLENQLMLNLTKASGTKSTPSKVTFIVKEEGQN